MQIDNDYHPYPPSLLIPEQTYQGKINATKARFLNKDQALDAMERGQIVRGIDGLYQTHVEHGGLYLYRWHNDEIQRLKDGVWAKSKSFDLNSEFEVFEYEA